MDSIHDLWPTAATYQSELREMFGIDFPGSPGVDDDFILEGWDAAPPYRRDFDTLEYSRATYREREGRVTHDPAAHMKQQLYPDGDATMNLFAPDRSQYPSKKPDGTLDIDLASGKYLKLWHGPNHPGITGNMSVEITLCGDEVVEGKTHVGYLHRGFEKLMERRTFIQCFPIVCRICVPEPDFNEYCYAAAVEELAGLEIPEKARWMRALILEMGRINSYLMYLGGQAGALGQGVIGQWTTYARDLMLDRFEELTGARIYHMFILPGGVRDDLPEGFAGRMEETLARSKAPSPMSKRSCSTTPCSRSARSASASSTRPGSTPMASPARMPVPPGSPATCARTTPTWSTRNSISRSPSATTRTSTPAPTCAGAMS
jgi:hypothetical protein